MASPESGALRLSRARDALLRTHWYFATAAHAMSLWERPGLGAIGVDERWRLYYDPKALEHWTDSELIVVFYHELLHLIRAHAARGKRLHAQVLPWNLGADAELNGDLESEGWVLPETAVTPEVLDAPTGLLAEQYYKRLLSRPPKRQNRGVLSGACGAGAGGEAVDEAAGQAMRGKLGRLLGKAKGATNGALAPKPPPGVDAKTAELVRDQTAGAIRNAHGAGRGTVPMHLKRWAEEHFALPPVNWRWLLARALRRSSTQEGVLGATDYSRSRPSRRQAALQSTGVVLSALRAKQQPSVAAVVDTSGSMDAQALSAALSQITVLVRTTGCPLWVITCDAAVQSVELVRRASHVTLQGGGGTDMRVGIARALAVKPAPAVVVVLTDGQTPWPLEPPRQTTIVCGLIGPNDDQPSTIYGWSPPTWMRTIPIPVAHQNG